ncbi:MULTISPECIES: TIR domain-containing protein [Protofrankia]|uniref:TIR domain-containing protein n=1 Tax=Protofrankia TaxID=2994361 RepID=UPI000B24FB93|nr:MULTISPECIES: TIR domain-containing protein [Protofrankia]
MSAARRSRPPVAVHVLWRSGGDAETRQLADAVFTHLTADPSQPTARSLGIPVRYWSAGGPVDRPDGRGARWAADVPPPVDLSLAERNVVVLLIDNALVGAGWNDYLAELLRAVGAGPANWLLPFALTPNFARVPVAVDVDVVDLHTLPAHFREQVLLNHVIHRVCRQVGASDPVRVFISYASADGGAIAREVARHLRFETDVDDFLDAHHISGGDPFADVLDAAATSSALLAVNSDSYGSRPWCQREFLGAKRASMPVVVLDALTDRSVRAFPYLGNVPTVRWHRDSRRVLDHLVGVLLTETLRHRYFPLRAAEMCGRHGVALPSFLLARPPELLTLLDLPRNSVGGAAPVDLLYPDPPLGTEESRVLAKLDGSLRAVTPTMLFST